MNQFPHYFSVSLCHVMTIKIAWHIIKLSLVKPTLNPV